MPQAVPGKWEVVGTSIEELEAFGTKLGRSLKAADKAVADKVRSGGLRVSHVGRWPCLLHRRAWLGLLQTRGC